ncbi:hypothetical protein B7494_g8625 [Chlorociboria aeruginascens]|nr:hypothetical protein B7494_g8625 [Chlorociboria aeruginascens]
MPSKPIPLRTLGKGGPRVPALGFGLMGMSIAYGTIPSDEERFQVLDRAVELGATFWDTADLYGDSEELLGKWFKRTGKRDQIFLASKFGYASKTDFSLIDSSAAYYYMHKANTKTPIEETMRALAELKAEGKIKHIALSEVSSTTLRRACKIAPVAAVQAEYSPFVLDIEGPKGTNLLATCRELGVTVVCYAPLGRGILTSAFTEPSTSQDPKDLRAVYFPRFQGENRTANIKLVNDLKEIANRKGCTVTQLALAWTMKQGANIIPIPGTKKIRYLEENWGALDVVLSDADEKEIRKLVEEGEVKGGRHPEGYHDGLIDTVEEA